MTIYSVARIWGHSSKYVCVVSKTLWKHCENTVGQSNQLVGTIPKREKKQERRCPLRVIFNTLSLFKLSSYQTKWTYPFLFRVPSFKIRFSFPGLAVALWHLCQRRHSSLVNAPPYRQGAPIVGQSKQLAAFRVRLVIRRNSSSPARDQTRSKQRSQKAYRSMKFAPGLPPFMDRPRYRTRLLYPQKTMGHRIHPDTPDSCRAVFNNTTTPFATESKNCDKFNDTEVKSRNCGGNLTGQAAPLLCRYHRVCRRYFVTSIVEQKRLLSSRAHIAECWRDSVVNDQTTSVSIRFAR